MNALLANPLVIKVTDQNGFPVAGTPIAFQISQQPQGAVGASLSVSSGVTAADGTAATQLTLGDTAGQYQVTASCVSGNCTPNADTFTGQAVIGLLPPPTNLQAEQAVGSNGKQVLLTWDYGNSQIDGFKIQRTTPSGNWIDLQPISLTQPPFSYLDTIPTAYATYTYHILAYRGSAESGYSNDATCFQVDVFVLNQPVIDATFTPDLDAGPLPPLDQVAQHFGYDHFNWINWVEFMPNDQSGHPLTWVGLDGKDYHAPLRFFDPPLGGWAYVNLKTGLPDPLPADYLPFYWNEQTGFPASYTLCSGSPPCVARNLTTLNFEDKPGDSRLVVGQPDQFIQFTTELVGVYPSGSFDVIPNFTWSSDFNPKSGQGGVLFRSFNLETLDGSGFIFNVQPDVRTQDLPQDLRTSLIQLGAKNISNAPKVDKDAPMTAAFLSGPQGTNGWYTGPVQVTLIVTDIDGPSDIAATTYNVDGGAVSAYSAPFAVSGDGAHNVQFGSRDQAGNTEMPRPSQAIKIDGTPPTSYVTPLPPSESSMSFTVAWAGSDAGSGIQSFAVYVSDNGAPFSVFQSNTTATSASFSGQFGHSYGFYSVTTDAAGNVEAAKVAADTVTTLPPTDFTIGASPSSLSITRGQNGTVTIAITPTRGFNQAVTFSCSGLPSESTCTFSSATVTPTGSTAVTTILTITTTAPIGRLRGPYGPWDRVQHLYAVLWTGGLFGIVGICFMAPMKPSRKSVVMTILLIVVVTATIVSCGGGSSGGNSGGTSGGTGPHQTDPGTPLGNDTVTVTAGPVSGPSHSVTIQLTVQ